VLKGKNLIDTIGKGWESFNLAFGHLLKSIIVLWVTVGF